MKGPILNSPILNSKEPLLLLKKWIGEAERNPSIKEPWAMALSTVDQQKRPALRTVLAKEITSEGIVFYTHSHSRKGRHLKSNVFCSVLFYWDPLFRQVELRGRVQPLSRAQTLKYWKTRPRMSQLSGFVSKQSSVIRAEVFEAAIKKAQEKFRGRAIPCPKAWSGYHLLAEEIEFWIGKKHRRHNRILFSLKPGGSRPRPPRRRWRSCFLSP